MGELSDLKHTVKILSGRGLVLVLDTGPTITSESEAMLQALHSRSVGGIEEHLKTLQKKGSGEFMDKFYVGYDHKSIGDCGNTTIFIEGVSMLVAKAIQDNRLYSGQESSTRYIDFSNQRFIDPTSTKEGREILELSRNFYLNAMLPTIDLLKKKYPIKEGEKENIYEKAIKARAFDITRSLLPAGASTNLAWHSNLRQVSDKLSFLRHHPLEEVREIADTIEDAVIAHHPNSFTKDLIKEKEDYQELIAQNYYHHDPDANHLTIWDSVDRVELEKLGDLFDSRPQKTELPKYLSHLGRVYAEFPLDFGSFRDVQRHRSINQRMPLLTTEMGFNEWYIENFPEEVKKRLGNHLGSLEKRIDGLNISKEESQYFIPMGYNISNKIEGDLPAMVYTMELRSSRFVHPTLRKIAREIGKYIENEIGIPIYLDPEPGKFDTKRGEHDITLKDG